MNRSTVKLLMSLALGLVAVVALYTLQNSEQEGGENSDASGLSETEQVQSNTQGTSARAEFPDLTAPPSSRTAEVPDFGEIFNIRERKEAFFSYLLPAIRAENNRIRHQRAAVLTLQTKVQSSSLNAQETRWLSQVADYYGVDLDMTEQNIPEILSRLERRVDVIPETLVLVQAANESGWGRSRFAQSARNFFGQWCWTEGCGIVPSQRPDNAVYEVRLFDSMEGSVRSYMRNLNTHFAYQNLREIREEMRAAEKPITATPLTEGLISYSERGDEYVEELQQMIRVNQPIIEEVGASLNRS